MKMVMVAYNEAMDIEVMEMVDSLSLGNYTKIVKAFGKGSSSGTHLGSDVWPGLNNILYIVCDDKDKSKILASVKEFREKLGHEGIKAFVMPVEEMT